MILTKYLMILGLFLLALFALNFVSEDASADTHVWISDSTQSASTGAAWDLGTAPSTTDTATFDGVHDGNCNWDIGSLTGAVLNIESGYDGTLTWVISPIFNTLHFHGGTMNADGGSRNIIINNEFLQDGGTWGATAFRFTANTDGASFTFINTPTFNRFSATSTCSVTGSFITSYLTVGTGKTLTLNSNVTLPDCATFTNSGTITGTGILTLKQIADASSKTVGTINCPFVMYQDSTSSAFLSISLTANCAFGNTVSIYSNAPGYGIKFDAGTNRVITGTGQVTIGNYTILRQGTGSWTFSSYYQDGIGSYFIQGGNVVIDTTCYIWNGSWIDNPSYTTTGIDTFDSYLYEYGSNHITWIGVADPLTDFTITSSMNNITWHDATFSYTITANKGFTATMTTDADWLSFNSTTNIASGTAITNGVYYCNITLTSDDGQVAFENTTITVMFPFSTEASSVFDIDNSEAAIYAELIFMIAMLFLQLYMVGRNKWIHLAAFMSLFIASIAMLTAWSTLYYVPFGFIMLSLLIFVFGMLRD